MGQRVRSSRSFFTAIMLVGLASVAFAGDLKVTYLHNLANFDGPIPSMWAHVALDGKHNEVYMMDPWQPELRIFNESGMEVYQFGDDGSFGSIVDLTLDENGNPIVLCYKNQKRIFSRCNFRGEPVSQIEIRNLSPEFSGFAPELLICRHDKLYLADKGAMKIVVTDKTGNFEKGYVIASVLQLEEKKAKNADLGDVSVDGQGNILFTTPTLFEAHILSPEGKVASFGKAGSGPGRFGVISGIAADERGNVYVSDKLRCVVMIFDSNLEFRNEFGYRGYGPANLIVPSDIAVDETGKLYVSQAANRGVSVFQVTYN